MTIQDAVRAQDAVRGREAAGGRWGWPLAGAGLLALLLWTRAAAGGDPGHEQGDSDVPSGTMAFFVGDGQLCPPGWRPATETRGRLVVAVTTGDTVGKQVGTELQNEEDRTHAHPFTATVELPYKPLASLNGTNRQGAAAGKYTTSGVSEPAPSGLPFIQLLACVKP